MIEVKDLSYTYRGGRQLNFGSFKIDHSNHSLILGNSGSGKTTLLHLLGGLLRGYDGSAIVNGVELSSLRDSALDKFRGENIGFVFQRMHLLRSLSVQQNLMVAPWLSGNASTPGRAKEIVTRLGLADKLGSNVSTLSQGQSQRIAIARAVMNKPALILADEPTSALDDNNCEDVLRLLLSVASESGATLVIATHDQRLKSRIDHQITVKAA